MNALYIIIPVLFFASLTLILWHDHRERNTNHREDDPASRVSTTERDFANNYWDGVRTGIMSKAQSRKVLHLQSEMHRQSREPEQKVAAEQLAEPIGGHGKQGV